MSTVHLEGQESLIAVLHRYIDAVGLKLPKQEVRESLLGHPHYPNLYSLSDTLARYQINNQPARIAPDQLTKLDPFFFAQLLGQGMVLVQEVSTDRVVYFSEVGGRVEETFEAFNQKWNGIIVFTDWKSARQQLRPNRAYWLERLTQWRDRLAILLGALLLLLLAWYLPSAIAQAWFTMSVVGAGLSLFLVMLNLHQEKYRKYCQLGGRFDCASVLNSPYARIGGWLPLADLSLVYFSGSILLFAVMAIVPGALPLSVLSLLAIGGVGAALYSLYVQGVVLKKWCAFCLGIVVVLLLQAGIAAYHARGLMHSMGWETAWIWWLLLLAVPVLIWSYLRPLLRERGQNQTFRHQYHRLKLSKEIFQHLQAQQPELPMPFPSKSIVLGKAEATHELALVLSPFCDLCAREYETLHSLLRSGERDLRVRILFAGEEAGFVAAKLLDLYEEMPGEAFEDALLAWYRERNPQELANTYGPAVSEQSRQRLREYAGWLQIMNIVQAPVVYYDSRPLSAHYSIADLSHLL